MVTIRQIAEEAGVPLALVGYYYGQKHELFHAIFAHWGHSIEERLDGLRAVDNDPADPRTLPRIIEAFTGPVLALRASAEGEYYALLVARELYHATEEADRVLRGYFDPLAEAYIDALHVALPHATRGQVAWGYQFALGAAAAPPERQPHRAAVARREHARRPGGGADAGALHRRRAARGAAAKRTQGPRAHAENPPQETQTLMKRRTLLSALGAAGVAGGAARPRPGRDPKIVFGYTAVTDFASVFVAAEEGYFKKRSLDVELKFIPLNSTIPAALQSDSLQIGGPTPSVFLQAVDGGLDLVLVAGGGLTSKTITGFGLVARAGSGIKTAQDCVGKKIGVPGLGAFLHVTFRAWLKDSGVDYRKVELRRGRVPAARRPAARRLGRRGGVGRPVHEPHHRQRRRLRGLVLLDLPARGQPDHRACRQARVGGRRTRRAARGFREAVQSRARRFMQQPKNDARVRASIGKYIKLPPEVLAKVQISPPGAAGEREAARLLGRPDEGAGHAEDPGRRRQAGREVNAPRDSRRRRLLQRRPRRDPLRRPRGAVADLVRRWRAASSCASSAPAAAARPPCCAPPAGWSRPARGEVRRDGLPMTGRRARWRSCSRTTAARCCPGARSKAT